MLMSRELGDGDESDTPLPFSYGNERRDQKTFQRLVGKKEEAVLPTAMRKRASELMTYGDD